MHDPLTLIGSKFGFDLWHRDPVEDVCGWSKVRFTPEEIEAIQKIAKEEWETLFRKHEGVWYSKVTTLEGVWAVMEMAAWRMWRKSIKPKHVPRIMSLAFNTFDSFQSSFDMGKPKEWYDIESTFLWIAVAFKTMERPRWRHPRWHFWHWHIVFGPLLDFKRWAFSRCQVCKKRFTWSAIRKGSVVGLSWESDGPTWFRNGEKIRHMECDSRP